MSDALSTCANCGEAQHYPWSVTIFGDECCSYACANKHYDAIVGIITD